MKLQRADRKRLPAAIHERQQRNEAFWRNILEGVQAPPDPRARTDEALAWTRRELTYTDVNHETFTAALLR
jgi:hypothetical protein